MQVALLGGTGDIGEGLALRIARDTTHDVIVGSRTPEKATDAAAEYESRLADRGYDVSIAGVENPEAAAQGEVVVLSVAAYYLADTIESVESELGESVLVSPAVGMQREDDSVHYNPPGIGNVTELAASAAPDSAPVVGAFHNLAAGKLSDLDADIDWDVPVVADESSAKRTVSQLITDIDGLRPLDAGALANAAEVESLTPLLINLAANNDGMHDLGVKFW